MSHLSTGETELETKPNTGKDNPELPIAAENRPEFPTKIQQYISERPDRSSVCVLRPVFAFCVLRHVRRKNNVRRHGKHGIY